MHAPLSRAQFEAFQQAGIEYLHAQLLYNRGITTPEAMQRFLAARFDDIPDPLLLIDMGRAVERITRALETGEHITIYGDFDADGVTSAALLMRALRKLASPGVPLDYFIPHRTRDARGLSKETLEQILPRGTTLLITTDCGSSDTDEIAYAASHGMDIIITDHHHPPESLPPAYAMINPWRPDCTYSERYLCGAGIAFKLAQALFRARGREAEVLDLLDLVAIGTVGDVAQLLGENHTLTRLGLQRLNATANPGLRALIAVTNLTPGRIRERDISYTLAPRINAAGRMQHASIAFELLTTDDEAEARARAQELEELNQARQQITEELMQRVREQARSQLNNQVVLVYGNKDEWPEGIIGLVAGRLSEEIHRPVFVLSQDSETSRGSARSSGGFNIIEALRERADLFERHGGHAQAAGFTIPNTNIEALHTHLLNWQANGAQPVDEIGSADTTPDLTGLITEQETPVQEITHMIDMLITKPESQLHYASYAKIQLLSPYGAGNPEPVFRLNGMRLARRWVSGPEGRHLRLRLRSSGGLQFNGTFFRAGARIDSFAEGTMVNIIFCLEPAYNPVDGESKQEVWLKILDMETSV